jgi:hypothetical protein
MGWDGMGWSERRMLWRLEAGGFDARMNSEPRKAQSVDGRKKGVERVGTRQLGAANGPGQARRPGGTRIE